ncbi:DUF1992 domain-containing protein [Winslowiella iniecta]|uniref:DnaJ homologue subfamily C member 28 conserved domain-containing protein n=1 Tax=Winslowiella iniecta TaxID=1560201 RepID=A0A0L7SWV8_9GAMM|nr:DUF1992 domain-containing protein [Winslowiella iniecta]KOC87411.1 hypothetical protein NG42_20700 [Winslowiella iniecta]KOC88330.1 hypothetical protein NG43_20395 [Winslowiella iniecta]
MWLIDQLVEQHIREAQAAGELDQLPGQGKPLILDDDSHVPPELRTSYRLLKNAGYLPPELEMKREAIELDSLLQSLDPGDQRYQPGLKRLTLLEMKLKQAGMTTAFLNGEYRHHLKHRFAEDK